MNIPHETSTSGSQRVSRKELRMPEPTRSKTIQYLTGADNDERFPKAITDPGHGGKFDKEGNVLPFLGNTFICHIDQTSQFYQALCAYQDGLRNSLFAKYYTFLPKPSFHMTIFCGVSGVPLGEDGWPEGMERASSLDDITSIFSERFASQSNTSGFGMVASGISLPGTVTMQAASDADQSKLTAARHRLQKLTGLYRSDIDTYEFHISLGYLKRWFDQTTVEEAYGISEQLFATHLKDSGVLFWVH